MSGVNSFAGRRRVSFSLVAVVVFTLVASSVAPVFATTGADAERTKKTTVGLMSDDQKIIHVLNRLGYGPRPGDVEAVRQTGIDKYIDLQLHPERISDKALEARLSEFETLKMSQSDLMELEREGRELRNQIQKAGAKRDENGQVDPKSMPDDIRRKIRERMMSDEPTARDIPRELGQAKLIRAVLGERQLEEVLVDFWFNHFNVFIGKGMDRVLTTSYERDAIRPHIWGKFEDLLKATAESPAMLFYLDNWQSISPNAQLPDSRRNANRGGNAGRLGGVFGARRRGEFGFPNRRPQPPTTADENTQRQNRQRPQRGLNENYARELLELHTLGVDGGYTQKDVTEVARCFTGWSISRPYGGNAGGRFDDGEPGTFAFRELAHDKGEKTVLGMKIPAGGGKSDGDKVLRLIARHPSTARFIATKLVRRFVADNPPQDLVNSVAETFMKTDGDLRQVVRAVVTSPQFFSREAYRAKVKTPLELVASALRAVDADTRDVRVLLLVLNELGMPLYGWQPPTGYPDTADHWVNTGALLGRLNFALALAGDKLPGTTVRLDAVTGGEQRPEVVVDRLFKTLLFNDVTDLTRRTIKDQVSELSRNDASKSVGLKSENMSVGEANPGLTAALGGPEDRMRRARERFSLAELSKRGAPLSEIAQLTGLVLGSPEFQRK